jgi:hypothetical protein
MNFFFSDRTLFFHSLVSEQEFSVSNRVLKNESLSTSPSSSYHEFKILGTRGENTQSSTEVFDSTTGVIFYTLISKNSIGCWNTRKTHFNPENQGIVAHDDEKLIFPNDLRLNVDGNLLVLSNKMPIFIYKTLNPDDINFRILVGKTKDLIKDTQCE